MTMLQIPLLLKGSIAVSSPFAPTAVLQVYYSNVKHKDRILQTTSGTCHTHAQHEKWSLTLPVSSRVVHLQYILEKSCMCLWSMLYYSCYTVPVFGHSPHLRLSSPFLLSAPRDHLWARNACVCKPASRQPYKVKEGLS